MEQPLQEGFTLQELVREALSRVNSKYLTHNLGRSKDGMRRLERVWQMELYRTIYSCLPEEMHISPDVGRIFATDGIVDFYISESQWAIELLIDGIDMKRHHERFQDGGKYSSIPIKSYIILDIRETRTVLKAYSNTWHITPNADFTIFNIQDGSNFFDITIRGGYPYCSNVRTSTQECEAMEFEASNLKRRRNNNDYIKEERQKRQEIHDVVKDLEKLVNFLTKREKYLRERGAFEEADEVRQKLDRALNDLTKILYNAMGGSNQQKDCDSFESRGKCIIL
ncbi:crinkler family protein [Gigaspora margarita]|uniref:Crinkler family protein n=1 Tax=Gigaspora margarita TaxID=4874 RepID=A0A8H3XD75_GIGMA|nr:crinkler family protein [Gigaspora margarita]